MSTKPIEEELIQKFQESLNLQVSNRIGNNQGGVEEFIQRFSHSTHQSNR